MGDINTDVEEDYGITFDGVSDDDLGAIETLKQIKDLPHDGISLGPWKDLSGVNPVDPSVIALLVRKRSGLSIVRITSPGKHRFLRTDPLSPTETKLLILKPGERFLLLGSLSTRFIRSSGNQEVVHTSIQSPKMANLAKGPIYFGPFLVTSQVFYLTRLSFALVNLKPLIPGHVLVSPRRIVPRVSDLTIDETTDLFLTVRKVGRMIERVYGATSLNIAIQDGVDAGQSVPHVHTHIIPRKKADLDHKGGTDAIYGMLDGEEGNLGRIQLELQLQKNINAQQANSRDTMLTEGTRRSNFPAVDNESRTPRSKEDMEREAIMLAAEMEKEND